jgi:hypothetical protein
MPPVVALPSRAASVANRFALRRSSSKVSVHWAPCDRGSRALDQREFDSRRRVEATSVRIMSQARRPGAPPPAGSGRIAVSVAGAFTCGLLDDGVLQARWRLGQHRERHHGCQIAGRRAAPRYHLRDRRSAAPARPDVDRPVARSGRD